MTYSFNTAAEYSKELTRIQNEQIELMDNNNMRLKVNRLKKQELTEKFFALKKEWRENPNVANSVKEENKAIEESKKVEDTETTDLKEQVLFEAPKTETAKKNQNFILSTDKETANKIIQHIAKRYGISSHEVFNELYCDEANLITEYMTGKERSATHFLMKRYFLV